MEEKESNSTNYCKIICSDCKHYYFNNGEGISTGCRAFPKGIPNEVYYHQQHLSPIKGQEGDYVYEKASYEDLSAFARYLHNKTK